MTFFSSLKAELKSQVWAWQCDKINAGQTLNKYSIVVLLQMATEKCLRSNPALISNGFKRAGIYPWNPSEPDVNKLLPSSIFTPDQSVPSPPPSSFTLSVPQEAATSDFDDPGYDAQEVSINVADESIHNASASHDTDYDNPSLDILNQGFILIDENSQTNSPHGSSNNDISPTSDDHDTPTNGDSSNLSTAISPPPYWSGDTTICSFCDKRILNKFLSLHSDKCAKLPSLDSSSSALPSAPDTHSPSTFPLAPPSLTATTSTPAPPTHPTPPVLEFSLAERINQLQKYEIVFLTPEQILQFSECFEARSLSSSEPLFQAWVVFKNATLPTEEQAVTNVLSEHTASNVQKKKTTRKVNKPVGPARYDPNSPEWEQILIEQSEKKNKVKKRSAPPPNNKAPAAKRQKASGQKKLRF